jgi:2-aminoadipate transaminase
MQRANIKLTRGVPPVESFPNDQIVQCTKTVMTEYGTEIQQYNASIGFKPLRQWIAGESNTQPEQILIGQGSLQLLDLSAQLLIQPGDQVFVEAPTYDRTITTLRRAGADILGFALEKDGPDPDEMERALKAGSRPKFAYLIPDFQNPSGTVMSAEKREAVVALAEKYNFWIFEDSPYRSLRYSGSELPSLYSLLPERVCQMSSFSKTICPGLRVGYMVVPLELVKALAKMAEDTYINSSYINQAIVFDYIRRGWLENHLAELKQLYSQRLDTMLACLDRHFSNRATWTRPEGGFFIGMQLNPQPSLHLLLENAARADLQLTDGRGFFANGGGENFVRLPFCGLTPEEIRQGIDRLDQVVSGLG